MRRVKVSARRGSFLPVLDYVVKMTGGPILELGVGFCSTPYLHWMCYPKNRRLVSYENDKDFFDFASRWNIGFHEVHCVETYDGIDLSEPWSIAFVDHAPSKQRAIDAAKLTHADFVVLHDSEFRSDREYRLSTVEHLFKYRWKWTGAFPETSVWSNRFDVNDVFKSWL